MKKNNSSYLLDLIIKEGASFFAGVPDSTLKNFIREIDKAGLYNVKSVNECEAVAMCAGYYMSTGNPGIAYMQNSGLGKIVNPMTSLFSKYAYDIPIILIIGVRGDTLPQHIHMSRITIDILKLLDIEYYELGGKCDIKNIIHNVFNKIKGKTNAKLAILIRSNDLQEDGSDIDIYNLNKWKLTKQEVIKLFFDRMPGSIFLSTTGYISRIAHFIQSEFPGSYKNFYMMGSMGCISAIGYSVAKFKPDSSIVVFDGDGSILMQMGTIASIGSGKFKNLLHIVLSDESYESTGRQSSISSDICISRIAESCGYNYTSTVFSKTDLKKIISEGKYKNGPSLLEIKTHNSSQSLKRIDISTKDIKFDFMKNI